jgi:hypothetical protein
MDARGGGAVEQHLPAFELRLPRQGQGGACAAFVVDKKTDLLRRPALLVYMLLFKVIKILVLSRF